MRFLVSFLLAVFVSVALVGCQGGGAGRSNQDTGHEPAGVAKLREMATRGNLEAQHKMAAIYFEGSLVARNLTESARWYRLAADQGSVHAQHELGLMYAYGYGVPKNFDLAKEWLTKAKAGEHASAEASLAKLEQLAEADKAKPRSLPVKSAGSNIETRPLEVAQPLALAGDVQAQFEMGTMFEYGQGVGLDMQKAATWYGLGAKAGDARCQHRMGVLSATGRGVAQDDMKSIQFFEQAAAQDYAPSISNLGLMYLRGRSVDVDEAKAAELFLKAAELGLATAQHRIGVMYQEGSGVERDFAKAMAWYKKAADQEEPAGLNSLAWLMATCPVDSVRDGPQAIIHALKANQLARWRNPFFQETLAAAYAETGRFEEAVKRQSEIIKYLETVRRGNLDPETRARLLLYEQELPYRTQISVEP